MSRITLGFALSCIFATNADAQSVRWTHLGAHSGAKFGASLAVVEDLNGDGSSDLVVGAPADNASGPSFGAAYVYSGATGHLLRSHAPATSSQFGWRVRNAGDVDGDGHGDYAISAPAQVPAGCVRVYSGATGIELRAWTGAAPTYTFGQDFDDIGDVDGDLRDDFAIGEPYRPSTNPFGTVYVYSGATGAELYAIVNPGPLSGLGAVVAGLGDVDGDGVPDFASSTGAPNVVTVFAGATGAVIRTLTGPSTFGYAMDGVDVDGDGRSELVVSSIASAGASGRVFVYDVVTGTQLRELFGVCSGQYYAFNHDSFGLRVADLGDTDGDGLADIGVGLGAQHMAYVFRGVDGALLNVVRQPSIWPGYDFTEIRGIPDLDGDGRAEIALAFRLDEVSTVPGAGKVVVYDDVTALPTGTRITLGDGSGAPCPCGNVGQANAGCANSTGAGAELEAFGTTSASTDLLYFEATDLPPNGQAILYVGTVPLQGGLGAALGAGLLCATGQTYRFNVQSACAAGNAIWGPGLGASAGWQAGNTRYVQCWYRDPNGPCGALFNFSNGVKVTLTP